MSTRVKIVAGEGIRLEESGGVVTVEAAERGSNSNGQWLRLADGTQICHARLDETIDVNTETGDVFVSSAITWTYPVAFSGVTPRPNGQVVRPSGAPWGQYLRLDSMPGLSSAGFRIVSTASDTGNTYSLLLTAIGRWA